VLRGARVAPRGVCAQVRTRAQIRARQRGYCLPPLLRYLPPNALLLIRELVRPRVVRLLVAYVRGHAIGMPLAARWETYAAFVLAPITGTAIAPVPAQMVRPPARLGLSPPPCLYSLLPARVIMLSNAELRRSAARRRERLKRQAVEG